jgi:hypothetical protein
MGSGISRKYSGFFMNSSKPIRAHAFADITWVTISICGCAYCRATARFIFSLRMGGNGASEYANAGILDSAGMRELLRILSSIGDGNSMS